MNVERWIAKRRPVWEQLEDLLKQVERSGLRSLDREKLQSLGRLYRSVSADLSRARALKLGTDILIYLNNLVVKGHNQVYQSKKNRWLDFFNFFYATFPRLVREKIAYILVAIAVCVLPAFAAYDFVKKDINFGHMEIVSGTPMVSDQMWELIEHRKMWTDDLQDASPAFASMISTNNIRVCIIAFALGMTAGIGTLVVLFFNGLSVGTICGVCNYYGMLPNILLFMVAHGSLELPAIFISGGAGLLLGRSMLFPGAYKRGDSIRLAARPALGMFLGCVPLLLIAGCIESFISPRTDLSGDVKIAVGIAAFLMLLLYLFVPRKPLNDSSQQALVVEPTVVTA
jgi:uncharacterized membrane protein SpoIIM required for sporulation